MEDKYSFIRYERIKVVSGEQGVCLGCYKKDFVLYEIKIGSNTIISLCDNCCDYIIEQIKERNK